MILFALLLSVLSVSSYSKDWDYLALAVRYLGPQSSNLPSWVEPWNLHGMWPNSDNLYDNPAYCDNNYPFNFFQIKSLFQTLNPLWTDVRNIYNGSGFWTHEWEKHGTCAQNVASLKGEYNFFSQAINQYQNANIGPNLKSAGITPSSSHTYSGKSIESSLSNVLGGTVVGTCTKSNGRMVIDGMFVCISKSLDIMDCPSNFISKTRESGDCSSSDVYYLPMQ